MAYQQQPCDSYFVEDDAFITPQQHFKATLRKQDEIVGELNRQANDTYGDDIAMHMLQMENETLPDVASIDIQQEIQWFMRPYLIDFLVEAHAAFQLLPETLFLAVNLLDRYCSRRVVYKRHYQLVGCAALLIAAKYGDKKERVPMIRELKSMCCSLYDEDMFTQMEWHVLTTLSWMIGHPTIDSFIQVELRNSLNCDDMEVQHMALYLCEVALYHKDFVSIKPSVMSRAALRLARGILGRSNERGESKLMINDFEVSDVILKLSHVLDRPSQVLFRKYAIPHFSHASTKIDNFLRQREALRRHASPPTPPSEPCHTKIKSEYPETPQKYGNMVNGYMTPPITPEGEYFVGENKGFYQQAPRCPVTPTPSGHQYQPQYPQYHHDIQMH